MTAVSTEVRAPRAASLATNWLASPLCFWVVLALYLSAHVVLRLWETPNLGKNDVQEALAAQGWAWGYHPRNPPLHTWLLMSSYAVFGVGLLAHVVLKYCLLGACYAFAYLCGRRLLERRELATIGALSLSLLTPFAWTVHTALTHTLLLAAIILATLWAAIRLTTYRRLLDYALFGALIGAGFLAKYSYPLFLAPLLAAMLLQPEFRRVILHPRALVTLAVAMLLLAPHGVWMATTQFNFVEFVASKQHSEAEHPYLIDVATGAGHVALGALSFLGPLILLAPAALHGAVRADAAPLSPWRRAMTMAPLFGLGLLMFDVIALRATQFEERYFVCALLMAPLAMLVRLDSGATGISDRSLRHLSAAILAAALVVSAGLSGRALFYNQSCDRCLEEMPVAALVHQIRSVSGFERGTIVADHYNLAGNLRIAFPEARAFATNYFVEQPLLDGDGQCLLAWNARNAGDAVPRGLLAYLARQRLSPAVARPSYVDAPLLRSATRTDRLAYWVVPDADGNCHPR